MNFRTHRQSRYQSLRGSSSSVSRIAPKPSRLTKRSPPSWNVESRASGIAARTFGNPPVKTPASPAEIVPKNVRVLHRYALDFPSYFIIHPSYLVESNGENAGSTSRNRRLKL